MESLPYELLQVIAESLLPRYQCRLALVSKHCHKYLYNDLLKWHARKHLIPLPKVRTVSKSNTDSATIMHYNRKLICYKYERMNNFRRYKLSLESNIFTISDIMHNSGLFTMSTCIIRYGIEILDGFYKYMDSYIFKHYASMRLSPLLSLPVDILCRIIDNIHYIHINLLKSHWFMHHVDNYRRYSRLR